MPTFKILSVDAVGLKGGDWRVEFSERCVLVVGPNGSRKSSIRNALEFLFGLRIEGAASANGAGIVGLVSGDVMRVCVRVEIDGTVREIARTRRYDRGTFKASEITIDGSPVDAAGLAAVVGNVTLNAGDTLLGASADTLRSELARLALLADFQRAEGMPGTPEALAAERERRKGAVNKANEALRAAQKSLDASVRSAPDAPVRPEQVEAAKADAQRDRDAFQAWAAQSAEIKAKVAQAADALAVWRSNERVASEHLNRAVADLARTEADAAGLSAEDAKSRIDAAVSRGEGIKAEMAFTMDDINDAVAERERAVSDVARLEQRHESSSGAVRSMTEPHCPTCGQAVGPEVVERLTEIAKSDLLTLDAARGALAKIDARIKALRAEYAERTAQASDAAGDGKRAVVVFDAAKRAEGLRLDVVRLTEVVDNLRASRPATPATLEAEAESINRKRPESVDHSARIERLAAQLNAQQRLINDQRERDAAEKATQATKAALASLAEYEEGLVSTVTAEIARRVNPYLAAMDLEVVIDGNGLGVRSMATGAVWWGVGLSGAQRTAMSAALSAAVQAMTGAALRLSVVEMDELAGDARVGALKALRSSVESGDLHLAVAITCHDDHHLRGWAGFQRVETGAPVADAEPEVDAAPVADPDPAPATPPVVDAEPAPTVALKDDDDALWDSIDDLFGGVPTPAPNQPVLALSLAPAPAFGDPPDVECDAQESTEPPPAPLSLDAAKAMIREAKLSTDALRVLADRWGHALNAAPLLRIASDRAVARRMLPLDLAAAIADAAALYPKRPYSKRKGSDEIAAIDDTEGAEPETDDAERIDDADA